MDNRQCYPLTWWFSSLNVSKSGFYDWLNGPESERSKRDKILLEKIKESHLRSRGTYGSPRIHQDLKAQGERCGEKRVARLMSENEIQAKMVRKQRVKQENTKMDGIDGQKNLLARDFMAESPNSRWVSDMTFIPTGEGWLYLAVIMDLYSRAIVGWAMDSSMTVELVKDALHMALFRRKIKSRLLLHSDQGAQYRSFDYLSEFEKYGIQCSMSRKGNCLDNAAMESFFHTLKTELTHHENYRTRSQAKSSIFEYIEMFYNTKRRHSTINYLSPFEFERKNVSF